MPPEWLDLGNVGQGSSPGTGGGSISVSTSDRLSCLCPFSPRQHSGLSILGASVTRPSSLSSPVTVTACSSVLRLRLLRGFVPRGARRRDFLFPLLHKVWHASAESAVIRVISDIFLLISLLEDPSPIICAGLQGADFGFVVEEVVARSVPFSVLGCGPILRHKEVSFLLIKKRSLVRTWKIGRAHV